MINYFRKNHQVFIVFIIIYCAFSVFSVHYLNSTKLYSTVPFKLPFLADYSNYIFSLQKAYLIFSMLTFLTIIFVGFYLVRININYLVIQNRTQFPALFFITIASFAFHQELFSSALAGAIFLLFAIHRMFGSLEQKGSSSRFFDAALLVSMGSLFYFNLLFFLPFLWISQVVLRNFNWHEFLYTIIGIVVPYIYIFASYFFFDKSISAELISIVQWVTLDKVINFSPIFLIGASIYILVILLANIKAFQKYGTTKVQTRKLYQILFYFFLNTLAIFIFVPSSGIELLFILSVPLSVLLSIYFSECRSNFINNIFFALLLVAPLVVNIIWETIPRSMFDLFIK